MGIARLASAVDVARDKLQRAVRFIAARGDVEYYDLMAGRLCRMETIVFVSYLMLRDAFIDREREVALEWRFT